jgi:prevent-host-death family protein
MCYKYYMTSVGIRELRQRASELLRLVERGETIEITDRGRPVAVLAPLTDPGPLERLRASGDLVAGDGSFDDLPAPLELEPSQEAPSSVLERLRADER